MKVKDSYVLACVRGQRKMSPVLGAFGLLYFTTLGLVLNWRAFWNLWIVYFFNFPVFSGLLVNRGYWINGYGGTAVCVVCMLLIQWKKSYLLALCHKTKKCLVFIPINITHVTPSELNTEEFFSPNVTICPLWTSWSPLPVVAEVYPTSEVGTPIGRSYVVPMRWMVIYEYEVPEGP
jgi:hypothetical protein